ncbi:hypothetical protein GGS23DRAFT_364637 [Durotheca rogersii]|uniref:uncharacterized protein n=1 Tax=Durotheca rogersii TaxID=419775 RepID=UPI00221E5B2E|nr:uncharacterized protein GGS23DRAFT_364637 [Durotheca rogersii]KAI5866019.1 hypothetical protein GGS23DRAFT_364637 [Durotheca rogersii]
MSFVNGKVVKFRASCDACNESKVRCSQTKPQCGRCAKQGIECIYGLSRRSHRTAPRVGVSQSAQALHSFLSRDAQRFFDTAAAVPTSGSNASSSSASTCSAAGGSGMDRERLAGGAAAEAASQLAAAFREHEAAATAAERDHPSSADLIPNFDLAFDPLNDLPTTSSHLLDHSLSAPSLSPTLTGGDSHDDFFGSLVHDESQSPADGRSCNCNYLVVKQLLLLPLLSEEENGALDAEFGQLKHAVNVCEECISCPCTSQDEISLLTTSILIGRIIEGFDAFMGRANPVIGPSHSDTPGGAGDGVPRMSWGALQIEPDEEVELKQHMWLIQLRKLQRVIKKLGTAVSRLGGAQVNGNSAHIMTCQCIHIWLVQKAETLQESYQNVNGAKEPLSRQATSAMDKTKP